MMNRLEELWKSADDGATTPVGPFHVRTDADVVDLLDAWYVERQKSIECEILLDQSRSILRRLLAQSDPDAPASKHARRLIKAIDRSYRLASPEGS